MRFSISGKNKSEILKSPGLKFCELINHSDPDQFETRNGGLSASNREFFLVLNHVQGAGSFWG